MFFPLDKSAMASETLKDVSLSDVFDKAWKLFEKVQDSDEPTNSQSVQSNVKEAYQLLVHATRLVSSLSLFSDNEEISEMSTGNIKFMLLPAFLGEISLKKIGEERKMLVNHAKIYFTDFLQRCDNYHVVDKEIVLEKQDSGNNSKIAQTKNISREEKIRMYKETKQLESAIKTMRKRLQECSDSVQEDIQREYYISWVKLWINNAIENLQTINLELEILENMDKMKLDQKKPSPKPERKPMKPILITKETLKNRVFGPGYRNVPTMSEEEYFQKELREGKIVMDYNNSQGVNQAPTEEKSDSDEDIDNEEKLQKKRNWDDWKDTHRRGEGNKEGHG